jgi:hypothetical protein
MNWIDQLLVVQSDEFLFTREKRLDKIKENYAFVVEKYCK